MKKIFLVTLLLVTATIYIYAQEISTTPNKEMGMSNILNFSNEQISTIRMLNKKVSPQFTSIGNDISLSYYEKMQKKKILALKHKKEIMEILTPLQREIWENCYGRISPNEDIEAFIKNEYSKYMNEVDTEYLSSKESIEGRADLDKNQKKNELKVIKEASKRRKEYLNAERDTLINIALTTR